MTEIDWSLDGYNYELPPSRIAQNPVVPRDSSRLLAVDSPSSQQHRIFRDLPDLLHPGDLLVLNNTRVLPARLYGRKPNGPAVEILLMEERQHNCWLALVKPGKRLKLGSQIQFEPIAPASEDSAADPCCSRTEAAVLDRRLTATVIARDDATGGRLLEFDIPTDATLAKFLDEYGHGPRPPDSENSQARPEQHATVYAERPAADARARARPRPPAALHRNFPSWAGTVPDCLCRSPRGHRGPHRRLALHRRIVQSLAAAGNRKNFCHPTRRSRDVSPGGGGRRNGSPNARRMGGSTPCHRRENPRN